MSLTRAQRRQLTTRLLVMAWLLVGMLVAAGSPVRGQSVTPPNIAAASDLQFALQEVADAFQGEYGKTVNLVFGSSGNFYRQILQGAPFEMYLSADDAFVRQLALADATVDDGTLYATGRIALFVPSESRLQLDPELSDLRAALAEGRVRRFAIANPEHAPYGRAARQALQSAGLWESVQPALILGENASQAAQFAASGSAEGGILPYSLVLAPQVSERGTWVLLPADAHEPLRQRMVLLRGAGPVARDFYHYVQQPGARAVLGRYGFVVPGAAD